MTTSYDFPRKSIYFQPRSSDSAGGLYLKNFIFTDSLRWKTGFLSKDYLMIKRSLLGDKDFLLCGYTLLPLPIPLKRTLVAEVVARVSMLLKVDPCGSEPKRFTK